MLVSSDGSEVEFRWKEVVVYWEGERGFTFDDGWGVDPLVTYVPDEATWDRVVPVWLKGRRTEVIERLKAEEGHVVKDDPGFRALADREVFRS